MLASKISKLVKNQGNYTPDLDPAIDVAGGAYRAYLLARKDVDTLESSFYHVTTTMGNDDIREHPAIRTMERCSDMLRKSLKEIGLTLSTLSTVDENPLDTLISKIADND